MPTPIKTTAIFLRPFELSSFDETLPPGEYEIESRMPEPLDRIEPDTWTSSVLVRLHPRNSHPGLDRTITVPLAELEDAVAKDKLTGRGLTDFFLEEMLADPMIRLVMQADGVEEAEIRDIFSNRTGGRAGSQESSYDASRAREDAFAGSRGPLDGSFRPGIGE